MNHPILNRLGRLLVILYFIHFQPVIFAQFIGDYYIVLDPGHGGTDSGSPGYNGSAYPDEKDFALSTGINADMIISDAGKGKVVRTRMSDITLTLDQRAEIADGVKEDGLGRRVEDIDFLWAFVSIHYNANSNQGVRGTEVYSYTNRGTSPATDSPESDVTTSCEGIIFAGNMIDKVLSDTEGNYFRNGWEVFHYAQPHTNDGIWGNNWGIFNKIKYGTNSNFAAILVEFEFITNPDIWEIVEPIGINYDVFYHVRAGRAIKNAWVDYFNDLDPHSFLNTSACTKSSAPSPPPAPANLVITNPNDIGNSPILSWQASSGADSYTIYRRVSWDPNWFSLGSTSLTTYEDGTLTIKNQTDPEAEEFYYQVTAVNSVGESGPSNSVSIWGNSFFKKRDEIADKINPIPDAFALESNYPNPFNPSTMIRYNLPEASSVSLVIYDLKGNEVIRWAMDNEQAGYKRKTWNGTDANGERVPAGIYLYRLTAQSSESDQVFTQSHKMVLLK